MLLQCAVFVLIFIGANSDIEFPDVQFCPAVETCRTPLLYDVNYRCAADRMCPEGYKCCRSDCYIHKVCVVAVNKDGDKIPVPTITPEASTDLDTEPPEETTTSSEFTITQLMGNVTKTLSTSDNLEHLSSTSTATEEITTVLESSTAATSTESSFESTLSTEPIEITESPITEAEGSGNFFTDDEDGTSSTITLSTTSDNDDHTEGSGSGDDEDIFVFPDDDRIRTYMAVDKSTTTNNDFSFDYSVAREDFNAEDGSGSGTNDTENGDDDEEVTTIESSGEGSGGDLTDNEPGDVEEILTTFISLTDEDLKNNTYAGNITSSEVDEVNKASTNDSDSIDIDSVELGIIVGNEIDKNVTVEESSTLEQQIKTTFELKTTIGFADLTPPLLTVANATTEKDTEETTTHEATVEKANSTLPSEPATTDASTDFTDAGLIATLKEDATTYLPKVTNVTTSDDRILNNDENATTASQQNTSTSVTDNEVISNSTTTEPDPTERVQLPVEGSGTDYSDTELDDDDEDITTYISVLENVAQPDTLNKENPSMTKPGFIMSSGAIGITVADDDDFDYDDNEVDEDIRNNFQGRIMG